MVGWLAAGVFGLMPFQYRPLRYGLFLYLPMSAIVAYAIAKVAENKVKLNLGLKPVTLPVIFLTLWHLFTQVWIYFAPFGSKFEAGAGSLPVTFILALLITGLIFLWVKSGRRVISSRAPLYLIAVIGAAFAIHQGIYIARGLVHTKKHLTEFSRKLGTMLNQDAVITGPYGATLTIDDSLKSVIYMFGLSNVQKDLFTRFNVTHVATDYGNWKRAVSIFQFLRTVTESWKCRCMIL